MKQLRILTGHHAGAQLILDRSKYVIGSHDQADIQITDWTHRPIALNLDGDQLMSVDILEADPAAQSAGNAENDACGLLSDLMPVRFGDVVLCVGPQEQAWPADIALMETLMRPPQEELDAECLAPPASGTGRRMMVCGAVSVVALLGGFFAVVSRASSEAQARAAIVPPDVQLRRAIASAHIAGVSVSASAGQLIVEGILSDAAETSRLRRLIADAQVASVVHRYAAATDVVRSIADAISEPGAKVDYRGDGVFSVGGRVTELSRLNESASRLATDLKPLVKRIEIVAVELPPQERVPIGAMLSGDDVQYVQTRDGVKHLSLRVTQAPDPVLPD